jgi:hypothetical protein
MYDKLRDNRQPWSLAYDVAVWWSSFVSFLQVLLTLL